MPIHPIDFQIQAKVYSTGELMEIFDELSRFQRWLTIEASLAAVQGDLGIIPRESAELITKNASVDRLDLEFVKQEYTKSGNSLVPLLKAFRKICGSHGDYIHFGATTQDIIDTGQVLEIKAFFAILYRDLRKLEKKILHFAESYSKTPMIGRTHGQQAQPITFGLKLIVWAKEIRRHITRLKSIVPQILVGQLSGAVGNYAAFGERGKEIARLSLAKLGLGFSYSPWHSSRDTIAETASILAVFSSTFEKMANEIFHLSKTEIAELGEVSLSKTKSSSTMPHKQNPVLVQRISVMARQVRALSIVVVEGMVHEHERDPRPLWAEWLAMPQICIYTGTSLFYLNEVIESLEINTEKMRENLLIHKDFIVSERLVFHLAEKLGRQKAQEKLHELLLKARQQGLNLTDLLIDDNETGGLFINKKVVDDLTNPENYIGLAVDIVDETLTEIKKHRKNDPEFESLCPVTK